MIWWRKLVYKYGWTPDSVIKFGCELSIRSMHEEEESNLSVDSSITWCKPNCDETFPILLPSIVITFNSNYVILTPFT